MNEKYKEAFSLIKNAKNILITGHTRPDGDSCGSVSAFSRVLLSMGKNVVPFMITPYGDDMAFLFDGLTPFTADSDTDICEQINGVCSDIDLVILVDTNSRNQLPRFEKWLDTTDCPVVVFDHHITSDGLGDVEVIETESAAAGQIVCSFLEAMDIEITKDVANCLYTAIASDTGWFRFGNHDRGDVYAMAGRLIERGVNPPEIYGKLYQQMSEGRMRLGARAISGMERYIDGLVATQVLLLSDFAATGALGRETGGIVQEPHKIAGVDTSVIFIEQPDGEFKCSMRSKGKVNVRLIAQKYDGGGHDLAAGVTIHKPFEQVKEIILNEIAKQINS